MLSGLPGDHSDLLLNFGSLLSQSVSVQHEEEIPRSALILKNRASSDDRRVGLVNEPRAVKEASRFLKLPLP